MRLRPPSLGFTYAVLMVAAVPLYFSYVNAPMWFEHPWGSKERDIGEARYLLEIARASRKANEDSWIRGILPLAGPEPRLASADAAMDAMGGLRELRSIWLRRALELSLQRGDFALSDRVRDAMREEGLSAEAVGLVELVPGVLWVLGLDSEGWTTGRGFATFIGKNPTEETRQVRFRFRTKGDGHIRVLVGDQTTWLDLKGEKGDRSGAVTSPPIPPGKSLAISIGADKPFEENGVQRGIRLEGYELVR
ncbi:MAG: hypothetical protein Fur0037_07140 [Planctomycetota bacterium]